MTDLFLSAVMSATGLSLFLGLGAGLVRRYSSALANSLWRGALATLWLVPISALAAEALQVNTQAVRVPLLPAESLAATPAAVPPEMVQPLQAVAQLSRARPDTAPRTQSLAVTPGRDRGLPAPRLLLVLVWAAGMALGATLLLRDVWRQLPQTLLFGHGLPGGRARWACRERRWWRRLPMCACRPSWDA